MKQDNPFSKLGALDQKLYQDTSDQNSNKEKSGIPENQNSRKPEPQKSRTPVNSISRNPDSQNIGNPEPQETGIPENQNYMKREFFTKGTYRLCDEALDAIGDAKKVLRRQYGVKVNMEEIVEAAILDAYRDLVKNNEKSNLVQRYSGNPEIRRS
jgi:hypothetical protein